MNGILIDTNLDPQRWSEGSFESGSILPSFRQFSWNWLISFFLKRCMVLGAHMGICVTELDFFLDPRLWPEGSHELGSVYLSFGPSLLLSGSFLGIGLLVFSQHGVRGLCVLRDRAGFLLKKFFVPKNGENRPKVRFFGFIGKFSHLFLLSLVYKECSYYLLYSCTNLILWKNPVPEIWAKMLLANQIAGFLNWPCLQSTRWKSLIFCMLIQITGN